jgi:RNA polymerase primary sigma factor
VDFAPDVENSSFPHPCFRRGKGDNVSNQARPGFTGSGVHVPIRTIGIGARAGDLNRGGIFFRLAAAAAGGAHQTSSLSAECDTCLPTPEDSGSHDPRGNTAAYLEDSATPISADPAIEEALTADEDSENRDIPKPCVQVDTAQEDLSREDLLGSYLEKIAQFPLLSPEREKELAKTIKEGQDKLFALIRNNPGADAQLDRLREHLRERWERSEQYPGLRQKSVEQLTEDLWRLAAREDAPEGHRDLYARAREIAAEIDAARNELVEGNLRLAVNIAKRYRGLGLGFLDLIQEGNRGLLKAAVRYDYTKKHRFTTYATWWVRQSVIRAVYDMAPTIRLPLHIIETGNLVFKAFRNLIKELDREPTPMEVAERTGLSTGKLMMIVQLNSCPRSLEAPVGSEGQTLGDFIADDEPVSPLEVVHEQELVRIIREGLAVLTPREESIIKSRFGLDGHTPETLENIGRRLNVSKERIRQIQKRAMGKLRGNLSNEKLDFVDRKGNDAQHGH